MDSKELQELVISALALALAFGIAFSGGISALGDLDLLAKASGASLVGVSLGFILHEMGHRFTARKYGCFAEYVMWPSGLIMALVFSLFGFVFAAPGAVMIRSGVDMWGRSTLTPQRYGIISLAGPVMNMGLVIVFLLLDVVYSDTIMVNNLSMLELAALVNAWLAIFNLIPFGPLDGAKIFNWDKAVWGAALAVGILLFAVQLLY